MKKPVYDDEDADEDRCPVSKRAAGKRKAKSRQKDDDEESMKIKRFTPLSWAVLSRQEPGFVYFAVNVLHVTPETVKDWCDEDLIRLDQKDPDDINVDKLKKQLSKKDRERGGKAEREYEKQAQMAQLKGSGPPRCPEYDSDDSTNTTLAMVLEDTGEAMAMVVVAFVTNCCAKYVVWSL